MSHLFDDDHEQFRKTQNHRVDLSICKHITVEMT